LEKFEIEGGENGMCLDQSFLAREINLKDIAFEGVKRFLREGIYKVRAQPEKNKKFKLFITSDREIPSRWLSNLSVTLIVQTVTKQIPIKYKILNIEEEGVSFIFLVSPKNFLEYLRTIRYLKVFAGYSSNIITVRFACGEVSVDVRNSF
jgi:hypothetical protein